LLLVQETLHATPAYYDRGAWFDAIVAAHSVDAAGPMRRMPEERSAAERRGIAAGGPRHWDVALDIARIQGIYFCTVPEGPRAGEVIPFLEVEWQRFFNPFARFTGVPSGQNANLQRCKELLDDWDIEGVIKDPLEETYMVEAAQIDRIAYLQNGYYSQRAGEPDFYWVDTMWDRL